VLFLSKFETSEKGSNMLKDVLIEFLTKGPAHLSYKQILRQIDPAKCHRRIAGAHTIWEELEHVRIAQEDIIQFMLDPNWKSPPWPEGYWPAPDMSPDDDRWQFSVEGFMGDLNQMVDLIRTGEIDLHAEIPHAPDYTYIREILLVIDHNAYHLGKIMQLNKMQVGETQTG